MRPLAYKLALLAGVSLLLAPFAVSQLTGSIAGQVMGEDGKPFRGAVIKLQRTDVNQTFTVKTNKDGKYFYGGFNIGSVFRVSCEVNGKEVDGYDDIRVASKPLTINFDLAAAKNRQAQLEAAAASGQLTEEQMQGYSDADKKKIEEQMQQKSAVNNAFNAAMQAKQAKQWDVAMENFGKAAELAPNQPVVWLQMADTVAQQAAAVKGDEQTAALTKAREVFDHLATLEPMQPTNVANYGTVLNNYALALYSAGQVDEGNAEIQKAITLNPEGAGQYYYNVGASLVNMGAKNQGPACEAFAKAVQANPDYAPAQFQQGNCLMNQMSMTADGKPIVLPGTREAFEAYLKLAPNGPRAAEAQSMLQVLDATVDTSYQNPEGQKKR